MKATAKKKVDVTTKPSFSEDKNGLPQRANLPLSFYIFFINKWPHVINKLDFNGNTKFSNLSSGRVALENLSKC